MNSMMAQMMAFQNAGLQGQDSMLGGLPLGNTLSRSPMSPEPEVVQNPEERFANQLNQLQEMGFWDKESNLTALKACNGSVTQAIEWLLAHPPQ
jgi:ubiquilin